MKSMQEAPAIIAETVVSRFEATVERYPDEIALSAERGGLVTYGELNAAANRIANAILTLQGEGNDAVMLFFRHGGRAYIESVMGALKARKALVAVNVDRESLGWGQRGFLDHSFMDDTYVSQLRDACGAELILTDIANSRAVERIAQGVRVLNTELQFRGPDRNPDVAIEPGDLVSIMHTTGTTGEPKAVKRSHGMEVYNMDIANSPPMGPGDRVTLFRSASPASMSDIFLALLNGARLCSHVPSAGDLTDWVVRQKITYLRCLGTVYRMLDFPRGEGFPHVRYVNVGGEPINNEDARHFQWYFKNPKAVLDVRYSSSETGHITHGRVDKQTNLDDGPLPVGYPLGNRKVHIHKPNDDGVGEIQVYDAPGMIFHGYLNNPKLTQAKVIDGVYFTGDRGYFKKDGALVHLGRINHARAI